MRYIYLLANLAREDAAQRLAEAARRHLERLGEGQPTARFLCSRGRVSVEGLPGNVAIELQKWCAEKVREIEAKGDAF